MPQQTSTFESHFLTHMQDVAGAYHKLIACSWVPFLQVGGLGKVRVNCFSKAITTWLGRESNPRPPDPESDALTTLPQENKKKALIVYILIRKQERWFKLFPHDMDSNGFKCTRKLIGSAIKLSMSLSVFRFYQ